MTRVVVLRSPKQNDSYALVSLCERNVVDLIDFNLCLYSINRPCRRRDLTLNSFQHFILILSHNANFLTQYQIRHTIPVFVYTSLCLRNFHTPLAYRTDFD